MGLAGETLRHFLRHAPFDQVFMQRAQERARRPPARLVLEGGDTPQHAYLSLMRCTSGDWEMLYITPRPLAHVNAETMPHGVRTGRMRFRPMARVFELLPGA